SWSALEVKVLEGLLVREEHAVVESQFRIELVAQHNVTEFVGQDHRQRRLIGQYIQEAATDHDGVPDGERFQRRGEQDPAADVGLQIDVVGHQQIVDHSLQNFIDFA